MDETPGGHLAHLDETTLTPVVRRAVGRESAEVTSWRSQPVHGGQGGAGIYRVTGSAEAGSETISWSVTHKVVQATADAQEPGTLRYWAREPLAYRSGALADLPGGLLVPECYGLTETPGHAYTMWLEDIHESTPGWTLDHYAMTARHLGRFNAA